MKLIQYIECLLSIEDTDRRQHFQMKFSILIRIYWNLFVKAQLTISQDWLKLWLGAEQVTRHFLIILINADPLYKCKNAALGEEGLIGWQGMWDELFTVTSLKISNSLSTTGTTLDAWTRVHASSSMAAARSGG